MTETKKPVAKKPKSYFSQSEFKCSNTGECKMDPEFVKVLNSIRHECGFPFILSSAYRSPMHPKERHKQFKGSHTKGKAVDILCRGEEALKIIEVAQAHGITRIGIQQKGSGRFIHLDFCTACDFPELEYFPEVAIWSY